MKVIIEVNPRTLKGAQLLKYIERLKADKKDIHLREATELEDGEMGLAGKAPKPYQLEEWLRPEVKEPELTLEEAKKLSKEYLDKARKSKTKK
jgi:hypothetical protein